MQYVPQALLPPSMRGRELNFYAMPFRWENGLAAGASLPAAVQVDNGLDFVAVAMTGTVIESGAYEADPYATVDFRTSSGRLLQSDPVLWTDLIGTAQRPGILPYPAIILAGTRVTCNLTNLSVDPWDDASVTLLGFNIFAEGWPER